MKKKILEEVVCPVGEGASGYVTFQNKYGIFSGKSEFNMVKEDFKNFSRFVAIRYAEIRAELKFAQFRLKQEKIKLRTIQSLKKDLEVNNITPDKKTLRRINLKLRDYSQSVSDWSNLCNHLKNAVQEQDKQREEILSRSRKDK